MVRRVLLLGVVLAVSATTSTAQEAVRSPRDAASGQGSLMIEASNKTATVHWIEVESMTYTAREAGSGLATGRRVHKPLRLRTTLAAGATSTWSMGEMNPSSMVVESGAVVKVLIDGERCSLRATIRRAASGNFALELGGFTAGWFKADGKLDPARCNAS